MDYRRQVGSSLRGRATGLDTWTTCQLQGEMETAWMLGLLFPGREVAILKAFLVCICRRVIWLSLALNMCMAIGLGKVGCVCMVLEDQKWITAEEVTLFSTLQSVLQYSDSTSARHYSSFVFFFILSPGCVCHGWSQWINSG